MHERSVTKTGPRDQPAWADDLAAWRHQRAAGLAAPYGWWSITCLAWLEEGENRVGSAPYSTVPLAERMPALAARLLVEGERLTIVPAPGAELRLADAPFTEPLTVTSDQPFMVMGEAPVRVSVVRRGDLWGVRVHDPVAAAAKSPDADVAWFPPAPEWVLEASFTAPDGHEEVPVSNVIGQVSMHRVAGRVSFEHDGVSRTLLATDAGDGRLFINFRDATNEDHDEPGPGPASYSGGRFLYAPAPVDGRLTLDFNRAHHPPCAHTPYATCPLPTRGNQLPFAVAAGERLTD